MWTLQWILWWWMIYSTGPSSKIFVGIWFAFNIVATLILLNGRFIIFLCVSVRASLFALMVLFKLLSSWSWDCTFRFHELRFTYCNTCNLIFSSLKLENGLTEYIRNAEGIHPKCWRNTFEMLKEYIRNAEGIHSKCWRNTFEMLTEYIRNAAEIKHGFVKLVAIF